MLIGTAVCGKPHVRWCERAGEIKPSPLYSIFQVFNPDWQKRTSGVIKGKMVNVMGKVVPGEMEIYGAEEPVLVVVWFVRPKNLV